MHFLKEKIINNKNLLYQIIKFGIVGALATIVEWVMFYIFNIIFDIHYLISIVFAYAISTIFNYIISIKWVFLAANKDNSFIKFLLLSLMGLVLNEIFMYIFIEWFIIKNMISKILATLIIMVYNFITRKKIIENKK